MNQIAEQFLFESMDSRTLTNVSDYATMVANEHWPEISFVTASYDYHTFSIHLDYVFNSEQDAM